LSSIPYVLNKAHQNNFTLCNICGCLMQHTCICSRVASWYCTVWLRYIQRWNHT